MDGYKRLIKEVPDFPIKGVNFKDISPLLADQQMFLSAIADMGRLVKNPDYWVGVDSRGYLFASAIAIQFGGGVVCQKYDLEYGTATLELQPGNGDVVIVDDVLATGGTLQATNDLANKAGYNVLGNIVLVDLEYVPRIDNFNLDVRSVVQYG